MGLLTLLPPHIPHQMISPRPYVELLCPHVELLCPHGELLVDKMGFLCLHFLMSLRMSLATMVANVDELVDIA